MVIRGIPLGIPIFTVQSSLLVFQGRQAMEWAINNIKTEMDELTRAAQSVSQTAHREMLFDRLSS